MKFKDPGKIDVQTAFDKCILHNIELQKQLAERDAQLKVAIEALKLIANSSITINRWYTATEALNKIDDVQKPTPIPHPSNGTPLKKKS